MMWKCKSPSYQKYLPNACFCWDKLGPGVLCSSAAMLAPGHTSPGVNYLGLKITARMHSWGRFWTKDTKRPKNPTAIFEEPGAKAGYCTDPCTQHHLSGGQTTSATPLTRPWDSRYPHSIWRLSPPPPQESGKQGNQLFVLVPPAVAGASGKPCLNFLSGLWSFFFFFLS